MLPDWIDLCRLFDAHHVDYLLVGGQAVIAHGYPRLTKDFDLWVRPTVPLISLGDLIQNKRAVGRLQDLADVEALEKLAAAGSRT